MSATLGMTPAQAASADWSKYRFDLANTGFNPGETTVSSANVNSLKLAWAANEHYGGSPMLVNGVLYLQCQTNLTSPPTPEMCAVNAASGSVIWHTHVGNNFIGTTPAVSGGRVFVGASRPATMYALDASNGSVLWSTPTTSGVDAHTAAPIVANGIVYMSFDDGLLHAYDVSTGHELWNIFLNSEYTTPALVNNVLYVEGGSPGDAYGGQPSLLGILYAVDPASGHILWHSMQQYGYTTWSPVVANGLVYVASQNDNSHMDTNLLAYAASGCAAPPCTPVWQVGEPATPFTDPAYWNGVLYEGFSDGFLYAVDASSGTLLWKGTTPKQTPYAQWAVQGAPVIANGVIYAGDHDGNVYAWNASGCGQAACQPLWSGNADQQNPYNDGQVESEPVIANGSLYVTSSDWYLNLYAFSLNGSGTPPLPPPPAWSGWSSQGGALSTAPASCSWGSGRLDSFAVGTDGGLWHNWHDAGGWHWEPLGGRLTSVPSAICSSSGHIEVFARGADNALWRRSFNAGTWAPWQSLHGALAGQPSAASTGTGTMVVVVEGTDRQLWAAILDGTSWTWRAAGGVLAAAPSAVSSGGGGVDAFVEGADLGLWHWSSTMGWASGLGGRLAARPAAIAAASGRLDAFVEGIDGALWHWSSVAGWEGLGGRLAAEPSAVSWGSPRMDVFVRGTDNGVWHAWFDATWHWEGLGGSASSAVAAITEGANELDIATRMSPGDLAYDSYR